MTTCPSDPDPRCPEPGCGGPLIVGVSSDGTPWSICYWVRINGGHGPRPARRFETPAERCDRENDEHIRDVANRCRSGGECPP